MDQGTSVVNGPHQGAWVDSRSGEDWFIHFQDKKAYGRIIHLQPMRWVKDWPVIGEDKDGDGKGQPVMSFKRPIEQSDWTVPASSDEFASTQLGSQWQWQANPKPYWSFLHEGALRLYAIQMADSSSNYWNAPNLLMQKFPAEEFEVTTKLSFKPSVEGEKTGLVVFGEDYAYLSVMKKGNKQLISLSVCKRADKGSPESVTEAAELKTEQVYFRVNVGPSALCSFSYSEDGQDFKTIGEVMEAKPGRWVGAKMGLFCTGTAKTNDTGYADVEWFRVESKESDMIN
jgi:beta-xylosidase